MQPNLQNMIAKGLLKLISYHWNLQAVADSWEYM